MKMNVKGIVLKSIAIGVVVCLLLIGIACISGKKNDRESVYRDAIGQINEAAGSGLYMEGITLSIPYTEISYNESKVDGKSHVEKIVSHKIKTISPEKLDVQSDLTTEIRKVGIYSAPIFTGTMKLDATFKWEPSEDKSIAYEYDNAMLYLEIEPSSVRDRPTVVVNGKQYESIAVKKDKRTVIGAVITMHDKSVKVTSTIAVRGAKSFSVVPSGSNTHMSVTCDWPSPGFTDYKWLPDSRTITKTGFTAEWSVPFTGIDASNDDNYNNYIGFKYVDPVDLYRKLDRAVTYGFLFIIVPFLIFFLFEIFAQISFHPVQYLLSGAACSIFFLLLLALSEHISFGASYLISAGAVTILVSLYIGSITKKIKLGFAMIPMFAILYAYLYVSLQSEDYALLIGALFAFVVLGIVMFCTRKVDWNAIGRKNEVDETKMAIEKK